MVASTTTTMGPSRDQDGVPLRQLAGIARSAAATYDEQHPFDMRAAAGSLHAANLLRGRDGTQYDYGDPAPGYVIGLKGHFVCREPTCAPSRLSRVTYDSKSSGPIPVATMLLVVDSHMENKQLSVGPYDIDLTPLGKVCPLDEYK